MLLPMAKLEIITEGVIIYIDGKVGKNFLIERA